MKEFRPPCIIIDRIAQLKKKMSKFSSVLSFLYVVVWMDSKPDVNIWRSETDVLLMVFPFPVVDP